LNTLALHIPPLRQRPADVSAFAEEFLMSYCDKSGQPRKCLMEDAIRVFESHTWPGNVRELKNVIERIVIGTDSSVVCAKEVSAMIHYDDDSYSEPLPAVCEAQSNFKGNMLGDLELQAIRNALEAAGGNRTRAAEVLGISRTTLWRKLRKHES
jgi:transcriptional regulator with PAS, ATPase and Fis domain